MNIPEEVEGDIYNIHQKSQIMSQVTTKSRVKFLQANVSCLTLRYKSVR